MPEQSNDLIDRFSEIDHKMLTLCLLMECSHLTVQGECKIHTLLNQLRYVNSRERLVLKHILIVSFKGDLHIPPYCEVYEIMK